MKKDTILVTGANGQLGKSIKAISRDYEKYNFLFTDVDELDITSQESVEEYFIKHQPNWVVNCAAYTNVDMAESERKLATLLNADAVEILAKESEVIGAGLVHISTDYVWAGDDPHPLKESSAKSPISVYGKTKLLGEKAAKKNPQHIIFRTSWLYSEYGKNFVKTMLDLAAKNSSVNVVGDQWGSPTSAHDLADAIMKSIENPIFGVYNFSNEGVATWAMFAEEIFMLAGIDCKVNHITTEEYPTAAKRPAYSIMSKEKFTKDYDYTIHEWEYSLERVIHKILK